jgi:TRAP-type C4-dicarboxylate transport system substrate-binding protein
MKRIMVSVAAAASAALALSACAGSAGSAGAGNAAGGEGFEYGASQEDVDAVLAELEPVTLKYQPSASSAESTGAPSAEMFKEYIEERSGGKIEIEIIWGQAIAPYTEIDDALADGRLDLAYTIPAYSPSEYPAFNALMAYSQFGPTSPMAAELSTGAMMAELAWSNEAVMAEFEDQGLTVLSSMISGGEYYMMCNPDNTGVETEDWGGRSVRAGSTMNELVIRGAGASPVSIEYGEIFEALQRNTVGCAFVQFAAATNFGIPEVAPNISYLTEGSVAGRVSNIQLAGSSFQNLPLAYQQIIFDAEQYSWGGWQRNVVDSKALGIEQAVGANGEIGPIAEDVQQEMIDAQLAAVRDAEEQGLMAPEVEDQAKELAEKWAGVPAELGYEDGGDLLDINDWYTPGEVDFMPFATKLYEDVVLPHRPE